VPYFISRIRARRWQTWPSWRLPQERRIRPQQINDFLPAPMELATSVYFTGLDLSRSRPVHPKKETERHMQRALLQYYKPENRPLIIKALREIKRPDLIIRILGK